MGVYNPRAPQILGQEWVPIRDEDLNLSPTTDAVEVGHSFRLDTARTLQSFRYYVRDPAPQAYSPGQVFVGAVYPAGLEASSGPIRRVLIPCNNGGTTGSGITLNGPSVAAALLTPDDGQSIAFAEVGVAQQEVSMFFATNSYPELAGKRILAANLRYAFWIDPRSIADTVLNSAIFLATDSSKFAVSYGNLSDHQGTIDEFQLQVQGVYGSMRFGEINQLWDTSLAAPSTTSGERLPWNYTGLQRFEASASNRIHVHLLVQLNFTGNTDNTSASLQYAALEVLFCDEQRLVVSGGQRGSVAQTNTTPLTARTNDGAFTVNPTLAVGDYTATISSADIGDVLLPVQRFPSLVAQREYYSIPPHPGVQVDKPAPVDETKVGDVFAIEQTHILPQLSLHTSGGPLTEVHVYGRQALAQVYGTITATQEILDSASLFSRSWPQVRYYARRFGNTTVPLLLDSPTITGSGLSVALTPAQFDALDEIVDGWKEITLRFPTSPTMGAGTNPQWRWSANGENAGDRWEVLGAIAPALSGLPGNLINQVASPHQLSSATYGAPSAGATINFGWVPQYAPGVTATSDDQTSDAVLIFSQDMPTITGFTLTQLSQPVSGIGPECGVDPCCIPSAILYNRLTWSAPVNTGVGADTFARTVAAGSWGSAETGGAYTLSGTANDFSVSQSVPPWDTTEKGLITFSAVNSARFAVLNVGAIDFDVTVDVSLLSTPDGGGLLRAGPVGRYTDANNNYYASVDVTSAGVVQLRLEKRVGGVITQLILTNKPDLAGGIGATLRVRIMGAGTVLKAKAWDPLVDEPSMWDIETTDSDLTTGNFAGIFGRDGSTSTGHTVAYDNLTISPPKFWFGYYELQRMDALTDWQTIMSATDPAQLVFYDYEARVGELSSYRIRGVNVLGFTGSWSSTVTSTLTEPGIEIDCTGGHILIFTSNSRQDGSINLAYSSIWEGGAIAEETFDFPEAGDVVLQKMYNKNFVTAFRPLERGGERFTRTMLVQAAAITPPTLGDFTDLRDMAWDSVPYICVRDEDGNRWFATVLVPSGRVQLNRTIYMALVTVVEVTDTAYAVDP